MAFECNNKDMWHTACPQMCAHTQANESHEPIPTCVQALPDSDVAGPWDRLRPLIQLSVKVADMLLSS